ncbi:MAG: sodium:solute symporter family protein [Clostridiales Family XIII bacterium]|jgi:SSS family solute:Na+ symporter|nr:sodium:solute symporter family protein [Clostridiales Family XIII bacterium]
MRTADYIIIIVYIIAMLGVGAYARTRIKSIDDYLVAGNRFKVISLVGTLMAALIGAGMTMGIVGGTYTYGSGVIWNYIGFAVGLVLFALVYSTRMRSTGKRTMAEIIAGEFGRLPRFFVGIFAAIYAFGSMTLCVTGMGRLLTYIGADWGISLTTAVIITTIVTVGYTALGGFYSVVWTDLVQFFIMIAIVIVIGPIITISSVGSVGEVAQAFADNGTSLFNPFEGVPVAYIIASFVLLAISVPGDPTVPQRALAGESNKVVKKSFFISAALTVLFGMGLTFIGAGAVAMLPNIEATYGTTEAAFPAFILEFYPVGLTGLGIAALMAAIMSTISAMLLVGTTHLVYDAGKAIKPDIKDSTLNKALPIAILIVGVVVTFVALKVTSLAAVLYFIFSLCGSAFLFPMLFTLYWKKASKWGITTGILSGGITCLSMYLSGNMGPGGDPVYMGMVASLVCILLFSFAIPGGRQTDSTMMLKSEEAK